jgi:Tfp pilus assembly protein PilV
MRFPIHSRRGQTLVEALVALSILTVGFVGVVVLLTKSFQLNRTKYM